MATDAAACHTVHAELGYGGARRFTAARERRYGSKAAMADSLVLPGKVRELTMVAWDRRRWRRWLED